MNRNFILKRSEIYLLRIFTIFMSAIMLLSINMSSNEMFFKFLNLDYGLANLMKEVAYIIIAILLIFYCYLYLHFWSQLDYSMGVLLALGDNKRKLILSIMLKRTYEFIIHIALGIGIGSISYSLLMYSLNFKKIQYIWNWPFCLLIIMYVGICTIQYFIFKKKKIMDFIKTPTHQYKVVAIPRIFAKGVSLVLLFGGIIGAIYLKKVIFQLLHLYGFSQ